MSSTKNRTNIWDISAPGYITITIFTLSIAYRLDAFGLKSKTDIVNRTAILIKGELMMGALAGLLKNTTHQLRPDKSTYNSFPSGHTAQAFAAATFLSEEYKDKFTWMPCTAYSVATGVGMMRMANNRHYISDVLVSAVPGILSMKVSYKKRGAGVLIRMFFQQTIFK